MPAEYKDLLAAGCKYEFWQHTGKVTKIWTPYQKMDIERDGSVITADASKGYEGKITTITKTIDVYPLGGYEKKEKIIMTFPVTMTTYPKDAKLPVVVPATPAS